MPTSDETFDTTQLSSSADQALSAINQAGDRAPRLVEAWVQAKNAAAVAEVAARGQGLARKAARRGLNVLKSRGVQVPERRHTATLAGTNADAPTLEAWMMAPDATGAELFAVTSRSGTARARVCLVFLHPQRGVARVDNRTMSHSGLREYFEKVLPGAGYGAVRVPVSWARHRIAAARKLHVDARVPEPMGFSTSRELLDGAPPEPPAHPFDDEGFELSEDDARTMAKDSATLHRVPEFRSWLPTGQAMQEMLVQVGQKLDPSKSGDEQGITDHLAAEVEAATDRYFSPQVREQIVGLMKDAALSVLARDGEGVALEVAATIKAIESCGLITDPPREVPFLRGFFDKAVAMMAQQGGGRLRIPVPRAPVADAAESAETIGAAETTEARGAAETTDAGTAPGATETPDASGAAKATNDE